MTETSQPTRRTQPGTAETIAARADRLAASFATQAENDDLVDIAYATSDSPFGRLFLAATPRGLISIGLPSLPADTLLERLATEVSPRILQAPGRLDPIRRQLDDYFEGRRQRFDLTLDFSLSHGFMRTALDVVAAIPYGKTLSYAEVAARAGSPRAHRAAGTACATNPIPIVVPCHRVLRSGGGLGGYGGGLEMKRALLAMERGQATLGPAA